MVLDKMTSDERLQALLKGEPVDRVPVIPFNFGHSGVVNGLPVSDIFANAEVSFKAQCRAAEMYGYEPVILYGYAAFGGWEFGGEIKMPGREDQTPTVAETPVKTPEEAAKLSVPDDIAAVGAMPIGWEFSKLQREHGRPVMPPSCMGPLDMVANVVGIENLMIWMMECPEVVHHTCRVVTDFRIQELELWAKEFGAENLMPMYSYAVESNQLVSPNDFETFALPYIKEMVEKTVELGVPHCYLHICGDQDKNLPLYAQVPYPKRSIITFGIEGSTMSMAEHFPGHIICGPVDPLLMYQGTADEVLAQAKQRIEEGKDLPGFALAPGCDVPVSTPPVNVYQMVRASKLYGTY